MVDIVYAPDSRVPESHRATIFLGGSIENGAARDWQHELINHLHSHPDSQRLTILNPRRLHWDNSFPIDDPEHPALREQILWELEHQQKADILIYYFVNGTISPITLLEYGCFKDRNPIVGFEKGYKRTANLVHTLAFFGQSGHGDWHSFTTALDARICQIMAQKDTEYRT